LVRKHAQGAKDGTNARAGHGSFGIIRKVKRKSDGYVGAVKDGPQTAC
jgi:hypothetical protein